MKYNIQQYKFLFDKLTIAMRDYLNSLERHDTVYSRISQLPDALEQQVLAELSQFIDAISLSVVEIPVIVHGELMDFSSAVDILEMGNDHGITPSFRYEFCWLDISPVFYVRNSIDAVLKEAESNAAKQISLIASSSSSSSSSNTNIADTNASVTGLSQESLFRGSDEKSSSSMSAPILQGNDPSKRKRIRRRKKKETNEDSIASDIVMPILPELPKLAEQNLDKLNGKEEEKIPEVILSSAEVSLSESPSLYISNESVRNMDENIPLRANDPEAKIFASMELSLRSEHPVAKAKKKKKNRKTMQTVSSSESSSRSDLSYDMNYANFSAPSNVHFFKKPPTPNDSHLPLHQAAARGDIKKIKDLVTSSVFIDINQQDVGSGRTALHEAAVRGKKESIKLLISLGADPTRLDLSGKTAKELARQKKYLELYRLLKQIEYGYSAVEIARGAFYDPLPPLNKNIFPIIKDDRAQQYDFFIKVVEKNYDAKKTEIDKYLSKLSKVAAILVYTLFDINAYLKTAVTQDYHKGKFGELSRACLAFLLQKDIPGIYLAKFEYMAQYDDFFASGNCIAISPNKPDDMYDLPAWPEDTLICDPYRPENERLYFINYPPEINAINSIKHSKMVFLRNSEAGQLQFFSHQDIMDEIRRIDPLIYGRAKSLISENYELLCKLQRKEQQAEIAVRNSM